MFKYGGNANISRRDLKKKKWKGAPLFLLVFPSTLVKILFSLNILSCNRKKTGAKSIYRAKKSQERPILLEYVRDSAETSRNEPDPNSQQNLKERQVNEIIHKTIRARVQLERDLFEFQVVYSFRRKKKSQEPQIHIMIFFFSFFIDMFPKTRLVPIGCSIALMKEAGKRLQVTKYIL